MLSSCATHPLSKVRVIDQPPPMLAELILRLGKESGLPGLADLGMGAPGISDNRDPEALGLHQWQSESLPL
jgi:hypothetical protein